MAFERLTIKTEFGDEIKAMFNPERYTHTKGVQIAEIPIPGLDSPVLQFVRGQNEKITMELFFDTTDNGMVDNVVDVRKETSKIYGLLRINPETHAPLRFTLEWGEAKNLFSYGDTSPNCILETVSEEFNLFSPSGIPLRAKLNVTFREAVTVEDQLAEMPKHSSDRTKQRRVRKGETITHIAQAEYGDPRQWRAIADANDLDNPRLLEPGMVLTIPRNTSEGR